MMRKQLFINILLVAALFLGSSAVFYPASVSAGDNVPPYLVNPVPEPGSTNSYVNIQIKVGIVDDDSYVDMNRITMRIDGKPPVGKPIVEPFYNEHGVRLYYILEQAEPGSIVTISVEAYDTASPPNRMFDSWQFAISSMRFNYQLIPVDPPNFSWVDFDRSAGNVTFVWSRGDDPEAYRLRINTESDSATVDFSRDETVGPFGLQSVSFPLGLDDWRSVSRVGEINWQIAPLDKLGGKIASDFSEPQHVQYCVGSIPLLDLPPHGALLNPNTPPTFSWNEIPDIENYELILVKLDEAGAYTSDVKVYDVPAPFHRLPQMSLDTWSTFDFGTWCWTVVGIAPDGTYSDYLIYRFIKEAN